MQLDGHASLEHLDSLPADFMEESACQAEHHALRGLASTEALSTAGL